MLLKGGGGGMGLMEVLGLTQKYVFGKQVLMLSTLIREKLKD